MDNPLLVQQPKRKSGQSSNPAPLFLIHDGGGTVFSYFLLSNLGRDVWAISNPYFGTESKWDGLESMAVEYSKLIRSVVPSGDIILGGWSLGGLLSIQIAYLLANDEDLRVSAIVMIDSFYPLRGEKKERVIKSKGNSKTSAKTMEQIGKCMKEARRMIDEWTGPTWRNPDGDTTAPICPPAILIRATEEDFDSSDPSSGLSIHDPLLSRSGFDKYPTLNLIDIVPCTGDHFSIFDDKNISELSQKIKAACTKLTEAS